jgi:hypothetical protein
MSLCEAAPVLWRGRRAFRLSNRKIEITLLLGGGHIADLRIFGSSYNTLFESPWQTIEPYEFSSQSHAARYGDGAVGRFLSGYTGHALVLGYFGMPSAEEAGLGLPLHGEAGASEWQVLGFSADDSQASLILQVVLSTYRMRVQRALHLSHGASSVRVEERVTNIGNRHLDFQWVEHATFGEPLFATGESRLYLSAKQGRTWPLGYEGRELLAADRDFRWPCAPPISGGNLDLSLAFQRPRTGFVAGLLTDSNRLNGFIAIYNRRLSLAAGYAFDHRHFPWIALWEENHAREYSPWNGVTRARGVEFGTSPMPLGLENARQMRTLFDTPVFTSLEAATTSTTAYHLFTTVVPSDWSGIEDVEAREQSLRLCSGDNQVLEIPASRTQ